GIAWFIRYWLRHGREWNWSERMPALVTASVLTAPYGWIFDQVVLALPIAALAAYYVRGSRRIPNYVLGLYTAVNAALIFAAIRQSPLAYGLAPAGISCLLAMKAEPRVYDIPQLCGVS